MSPGMDQYLTWAPTEMAAGADWLALKADLVEDSASAIRDAGERGTEGQCGQFITQRARDAADAARQVFELADLLREASNVVRQAAAELDVMVARLRDIENELVEKGFVREGELVRDTRTTYADATERDAREALAADFSKRIWGLLGGIRDADERANRDLHGIVGREVRDRTAAGNGDPRAVRLSDTAVVAAAAATGASLVEDKWFEAVLDSGRGLTLAKSLGPVMTGLGFLGGVASRPEGEPLHEAIIAEGIGTIAGAAGPFLGFALGAAVAGPLGGVVGGVTAGLRGAPYVSALASSWVRSAFDRAN